MHVPFDPSSIEWSAFLINSGGGDDAELMQFGGGANSGGAAASYGIFRGVPYQRGSGVGSVFRSLVRYLMPFGREVGAALGRQGLESGQRILANVLEGRNLRDSLVDEGRVAAKSLMNRANADLSARLTANKQSGGSLASYKKAARLPPIRKRLGLLDHSKNSTNPYDNSAQPPSGQLLRSLTSPPPLHGVSATRPKRKRITPAVGKRTPSSRKRRQRVDTLGVY